MDLNPKQHFIQYQILTKSDNKLDLIYKPDVTLEFYKVFPKPSKKVRFEQHTDVQEYYREGEKPLKKVRKHNSL